MPRGQPAGVAETKQAAAQAKKNKIKKKSMKKKQVDNLRALPMQAAEQVKSVAASMTTVRMLTYAHVCSRMLTAAQMQSVAASMTPVYDYIFVYVFVCVCVCVCVCVIYRER